MQNPFTTTFSKAPEQTYITTNEVDEILENFSYDRPSESVYKLTGVRGSGKTVNLAVIEEKLRNDEAWEVLDLNPTRDMLLQMAAGLVKLGYGKERAQGKSINVSAQVLGTGAGIGFSNDRGDQFFDIGAEIEEMLINAGKKNKKILIGVDEVSRTSEMICLTSEFGKWLRAGYPVYMVCTGLFENVQNLCNVENLTFFRRATTLKTERLNHIRMAEMYKTRLDVDAQTAREMADITRGYAYAYQQLGVLYFKKKEKQELSDIIAELKSELFAYSYEKIWEEMTENDRFFVKLMTEKGEYKREELLRAMGDKAKNYSVYRDRLLKRGILESRYSYISFALPFFAEFVEEYGV